TPNMVDAQCGSSDISQSKPAKLEVSASKGSPQLLIPHMRSLARGSDVWSWRAELRASSPARTTQSARYTAARTLKNDGSSHAALRARAGSSATREGFAQE